MQILRRTTEYTLPTGTNFKLVYCWLLMQCLLLSLHGIYIGGEAGKYVYEAHRLLATQDLSSNNYLLYITTIGLIYISVKAGAGFYLALLAQLSLNLLATLSFHKLAQKFTDKTTAFLATISLITFYPYQQFNFFLQTESIYFSLVVLLTSYILRLTSLHLSSFLAILLAVAVLTVTRPTGLLVSVPVFLYLHFAFMRKKNQFIVIPAYMIALIIAGIIFNAIMGSGGELNFLLPFVQEHIICGVPTRLVPGISFSQQDNSIIGVLTYVSNHAEQVLQLGIKRSIAFFGLYRDYFSTVHNTLNIAAFSLLYIFMFFSLYYWAVRNKVIACYFLFFIAVTWFTVIFTCDDWHNRFILCLVPMFLLLALPALGRFLRKIY